MIDFGYIGNYLVQVNVYQIVITIILLFFVGWPILTMLANAIDKELKKSKGENK